jgi:hypothetical protein
MNSIPMPTHSEQIYLQQSYYLNYLKTKFVDPLWISGQSITTEEYKFYATEPALKEFIITNFSSNPTIYTVVRWESATAIKSDNCFIRISSVYNGSADVEILGTTDEVSQTLRLFKENFTQVGSTIEWVYNRSGDSVVLPINTDLYPRKEFYPFLQDKPLEQYYDEFMNSRESILILIGPPGTGKTTFIKGLIAHTKTSAIVSYDVKVLEDDDIFASFIRDNQANLMVLEDADTLLAPRSEGNSMIMKFLNVGDGLVSCRNKKIIFTTNLASVKEIDQALVRPGRCFDILYFDKLKPDQAKVVSETLGLDGGNFSEDVPLAEVFNIKPPTTPTKPKPKSIGFI